MILTFLSESVVTIRPRTDPMANTFGISARPDTVGEIESNEGPYESGKLSDEVRLSNESVLIF